MEKMDKKSLRGKLYTRDGKTCHYCGIDEEEFNKIWKGFYRTKRGKRLEIDRKDNEKGYTLKNCVLACAICNCAKSDKFSYDEFKKVGKVIKQIWKERESKGRTKMKSIGRILGRFM